MMGDKSLFYITVITLVGIVSILGLSFHGSGNLDAAAVAWDREISTDGYHSECTIVQDPLHNFDERGIVDYENYRYYDFCNNDKLFQVTCSSSVKVGLLHGYQCPHGCEEGACVS